MKLSVDRRCPRGCQSRLLVPRRGSQRRIKGRSFVHILSSPPRLLFSPLSSPSIVDLGCCRWLPWHAGHIEVSIYCSHRCSIPTAQFVGFPLRVDPPVIQPVAHHAGPCFYTQVSHITAEGLLCGWGNLKKRGGCRY
jgi:hypothetical protein